MAGEPDRIELAWDHDPGSPEARMVQVALASVDSHGQRLASYQGGVGLYAAVLAANTSARDFEATIGRGGRLVVGVQEGDEPWRVGIGQPGEAPGWFVQRSQQFPWVLIPLADRAMRAFMGHVYSGTTMYRARTLGVDASGPSVRGDLSGISLYAARGLPGHSDWVHNRHTVKVVNRHDEVKSGEEEPDQDE